MTVNPIPPADHVIRHVVGRLILREQRAVFAQAFELRKATTSRPAETYLSASWLEHFAGDRRSRLAQVLHEMRGYREVKAKDGFALMNVGRTITVAADAGRRIRILHEPTDRAPSYAAIRGVQTEDSEIAQLLAAEAIAELVDVATISDGAGPA